MRGTRLDRPRHARRRRRRRGARVSARRLHRAARRGDGDGAAARRAVAGGRRDRAVVRRSHRETVEHGRRRRARAALGPAAAPPRAGFPSPNFAPKRRRPGTCPLYAARRLGGTVDVCVPPRLHRAKRARNKPRSPDAAPRPRAPPPALGAGPAASSSPAKRRRARPVLQAAAPGLWRPAGLERAVADTSRGEARLVAAPAPGAP